MSTRRPDRFERENGLLFAAGRITQPPNAGADPQSLDWEYVLRAADRQGVAPLLHDWLTRHRECIAPERSAAWLYHAYWANHFRNRLLLSELERVADAAAAKDIAVMPLKGARLAVDYYRTPALRPLSDLDLLIRAEDLEGMGAALCSLGYRELARPPSYVDERSLDRRSREHQWWTTRDGVRVLVEYRAEPMEPAVAQLADLDRAFTDALGRHVQSIWSRARPTSTGFWMSPEDLLLHVATHLGARHADFRLIWLHDLALVAARHGDHLDWERVGAAAGRLRVAGPVRAALEAAVRWIGAPIPITDFERALPPSGRRPIFSASRWEYRRLSERVAGLDTADLTVDAPSVWRLGAAFARLSGWGPRLRGLRWAVLPTREFLGVWHDRSATAGGLGYVTTCVRRAGSALARTMLTIPRRGR